MILVTESIHCTTDFQQDFLINPRSVRCRPRDGGGKHLLKASDLLFIMSLGVIR